MIRESKIRLTMGPGRTVGGETYEISVLPARVFAWRDVVEGFAIGVVIGAWIAMCYVAFAGLP